MRTHLNISRYKFLGDSSVARSAKNSSSRYGPDALLDLLGDLVLLSRTDFLVCTFSSQVCRISYELMQGRFPDASDRQGFVKMPT